MKASDLETFYFHYILCALWSSNDESTPDGGVPFDRNYCRSDISKSSQEVLIADCKKFLLENEALIFGEGRDRALEHAAHDFWLTQNHHGVGFWDGDWPLNGDALTEACAAYRERNLYLGDDGKIHV